MSSGEWGEFARSSKGELRGGEFNGLAATGEARASLSLSSLSLKDVTCSAATEDRIDEYGGECAAAVSAETGDGEDALGE